MKCKTLISILFCAMSVPAFSAAHADVTVQMNIVGKGLTQKNIGTVTFRDSRYGMMITPDLHGLPPGARGFHIHATPDCGDNGMAAGSHLDPKKTDSHEGPYQSGHLGDLPVLVVNNDGIAKTPTLAPRFKINMLKGHALMIHAGSDNYSDQPEKNGGGGPRYACGVIQDS